MGEQLTEKDVQQRMQALRTSMDTILGVYNDTLATAEKLYTREETILRVIANPAAFEAVRIATHVAMEDEAITEVMAQYTALEAIAPRLRKETIGILCMVLAMSGKLTRPWNEIIIPGLKTLFTPTDVPVALLSLEDLFAKHAKAHHDVMCLVIQDHDSRVRAYAASAMDQETFHTTTTEAWKEITDAKA